MCYEMIEELQDLLNELVSKNDKLNEGIILNISEELDKLINIYYTNIAKM